MIFITSEAMRFQCDEKTLEIFANIKNIDELKKIISESKNILKNIQEKIFNKNKIINWKDYTSQLRGDWKKYSEQFNKFRTEIWEELINLKSLSNFVFENQNEINQILETKNEKEEILKLIEELFNRLLAIPFLLKYSYKI
ncbi:hypothetical protein [Spiroplasma endosymbiont of Eupeodes luniger]|uniref:hypothetical protein n=1 Tax=Spiroplasma endosymbiont of Eupeodes luniger TaxID=3066300 RepID=UPI0030D296CB